MFAESYLHDLITSACPINGIHPLNSPSEVAAWPNLTMYSTSDGKNFMVDPSPAATPDQITAMASIISGFNYSTAESTLGQIRTLESSVTNRIRDEAGGGDTTVNPSFCGGTGGTASQHLTWVINQKAALRAKLPK